MSVAVRALGRAGWKPVVPLPLAPTPEPYYPLAPGPAVRATVSLPGIVADVC